MNTSTRWRRAHRFTAYSLDHASRIRRDAAPGTVGECPECHLPLKGMVAKDGEEEIWLVRCLRCRRSLLLWRGADSDVEDAGS